MSVTAGSSGSVQLDEQDKVGRENYDKLHYVCFEAAPKFLRRVFYEFWKAIEGGWEDSRICGQKLMEKKGMWEIVGRGKKIQKSNVESGKSLLWDLSLLVDILNVIRKENPQVILTSHDLSAFTKDNLEWLKKTRNQVAHAGSIDMDTKTFQPLWDKTFKILTSMGLGESTLKRPEVIVETEAITPISEEKTESTKKAEEYKALGNELYGQKCFLEAVTLYSKAIELEGVPQDLLGILYSNRSAAHLEMNDLEGAKDDAKSSITLRPNFFRGYSRLGQAYEHAKKYSKASLNFSLAIRLGDKSKKTVDSFEYCKMMVHKLSRSEHTDPDMIKSKDMTYSLNKGFLANILGKAQGMKFLEGTGLQLCQTAHCYYWGLNGFPQDFERAADYFAKAASMGDAEGLYNMALLTRDGKGVKRDVVQAHRLLEEAAEKAPIVEHVKGSGLKTRNIGVMEACHALGMSYDFGNVVKPNPKLAMKWYMKALEYGSGMSANNIALMYESPEDHPPDFGKALDFWKLSAYLGTVRGMENAANSCWNYRKFSMAQEWYHYALHKGSIDLKLLRNKYVRDFQLEKSFDPEKFERQLKKDLRDGSVSGILEKIETNKVGLLDISNEEAVKKMLRGDSGENEGDFSGRAGAIRRHRILLKGTRTKKKKPPQEMTTAAPNILPTASAVDLIGLQEILFKEMEEQKEDTVYTGRVMKLRVIEDAVLGNPSIGLLVEDSNGDVGRLFVYKYPQRKQTHEELGYGCRLTLIYPHYRTMDDGIRGLRVDDPDLILKHLHLRNLNRCRYCGTAEGGKVPCRTCRRVTYCSKLCL